MTSEWGNEVASNRAASRGAATTLLRTGIVWSSMLKHCCGAGGRRDDAGRRHSRLHQEGEGRLVGGLHGEGKWRMPNLLLMVLNWEANASGSIAGRQGVRPLPMQRMSQPQLLPRSC